VEKEEEKEGGGEAAPDMPNAALSQAEVAALLVTIAESGRLALAPTTAIAPATVTASETLVTLTQEHTWVLDELNGAGREAETTADHHHCRSYDGNRNERIKIGNGFERRSN